MCRALSVLPRKSLASFSVSCNEWDIQSCRSNRLCERIVRLQLFEDVTHERSQDGQAEEESEKAASELPIIR